LRQRLCPLSGAPLSQKSRDKSGTRDRPSCDIRTPVLEGTRLIPISRARRLAPPPRAVLSRHGSRKPGEAGHIDPPLAAVLASSDVLDTLAEPDSKSESPNRQPAVVLAAVKDRPSGRPQGSSLTPPLRATTAPGRDGRMASARGQTKEWRKTGGQNAVRPDTLIPSSHLSTKPG
jgi:hypothetical protein